MVSQQRRCIVLVDRTVLKGHVLDRRKSILVELEAGKTKSGPNLRYTPETYWRRGIMDYLKPQTHLVKGLARKEIPALA